MHQNMGGKNQRAKTNGRKKKETTKIYFAKLFILFELFEG